MKGFWWSVVVATALWFPAVALAQPAQDAPDEEQEEAADEGEAEGSEADEQGAAGARAADETEAGEDEAGEGEAGEGEAGEGEPGEETAGSAAQTTEATGEAPSPSEAAEAAQDLDETEDEAPRAAEPLTKRGGESRPDTGIPLEFDLHGYYRARLNWFNSIPVADTSSAQSGEDARFGFQRLRLSPSVLYGSKKDSPVAALHMQVDALDNVVFGDNARIARTPLFASDPSNTDLEGFELQDTIELKRAWLEFLIPVGQIRIGRMPSMWGQGILTHDGNGLGEWGDPLFGTTYDRVLFATRPLTIVNALTKGDSRETPLILAIAYDWLVESPVNDAIDPPTGIDVGPVDKQFESRSGGNSPIHSFVNGNRDDVQEQIVALVWSDPDWRVNSATDSLMAGYYFVYRWQDMTDSQVYINDFTWDIQAGLSPGGPSFFTAGEFLSISGHSRGISLAGGCDDPDGSGPDPEKCNRGEANIFGFVGRAGVKQPDKWSVGLESGFSSGDGELFNDPDLTVRPLHPDYHVGLLMYQVAIAAKGSIGLGEAIRPLWPRGGVWNSVYFWPQGRYTLIPGIELHAGFLVAWAHKLLPTVYVNTRDDASTSCQFDSDCFIGWEADLALRVKWGENDLMNWDTEFGVMGAGDAMSGSRVDALGNRVDVGLKEEYLWTVQTRIGMVF